MGVVPQYKVTIVSNKTLEKEEYKYLCMLLAGPSATVWITGRNILYIMVFWWTPKQKTKVEMHPPSDESSESVLFCVTA